MDMFAKVIDFFKPPEYEGTEQSQRVRFLHIALWVATVALFLLGVENTPGKDFLPTSLFMGSGICLICIPINKRGYYTPVAFFIAGLILVLITYSLIAGVGLRDAGLIAYPIFIIFTSYLLSKKAILYTTLLSIGSVLIVYYFEWAGLAVPAKYSDESQLNVILVLLPAAGFLLWVVADNLERSMKNLRDTYAQTLAGWGQALEYHDRETQGHSQRVVEMTLDLAKRMGMRGQRLEHIRQGVLLHDIGKMAIPDTILLKHENLTDDEWKLVKKHPVYARKMLEGIPFLKSSLDIPYSHHERWDGSGYPEGLSGEQIPIAARIFAVVDVWDALISDRPYHKAWTETQALEFIRDQAGKQFDPQVVESFLEMMKSNESQSGRN